METKLFDGETFDARLDGIRLTAQFELVKALMIDGLWRTLAQITSATGAPNASVSARLRDLRKAHFGGFVVERRRVGSGRKGVYEYRVLFNQGA